MFDITPFTGRADSAAREGPAQTNPNFIIYYIYMIFNTYFTFFSARKVVDNGRRLCYKKYNKKKKKRKKG